MNDGDRHNLRNGFSIEGHAEINDDLEVRNTWKNLSRHLRPSNRAPNLWLLCHDCLQEGTDLRNPILTKQTCTQARIDELIRTSTFSKHGHREHARCGENLHRPDGHA